MAKAKTASKKTAKAPAWKSLKHARGPATRVPQQIEQLIHPGPPSQGEHPYWALRDALVGQGVWFDASAPAVGLLLDSVAQASDPAPLFSMAADILGGDQIRGWLAPPSPPSDDLEKAAHEAAVERKDVLLAGLASSAGVVRGAAAMALAMLPELAGESVPALTKAAAEDADDIGRAGALLALGRLAIGDLAAAKAIDAARAATAPLVRGAAGMAWLRQDPKRSFDDAKGELRGWLGYIPPDGLDLPLFRGPFWFRMISFPDGAPRALSALAKSRGKAGVDALADTAVALAGSDTGVVDAQLGKILLDLGGFPTEPVPSVALVDELPEGQKAIAKKLAPTHLLPGGGHGLPASGAVRRRWMGIDPPGPLDRRVESAGGPPQPLWRAWQKRMPEPADFSSPIDRWQGLVEYASGSYPPFFRGPKVDEVDAEIAALPANDEALARVQQVADDLADRFASIARIGGVPQFFLNGRMLLLMPWIRAGRPIPEKWDVLVHVGTEPQAREMLQALPPERREAVLIARMRAAPPPARWGWGRAVLSLIDLAPTRNVADTLRWLIGEIAKMPATEAAVTELTTGLAEATKKHASLAS